MIYLTVAILFLNVAKKLYIVQEMNLSIMDFFSKGEENFLKSFLRIWSQLLKKSCYGKLHFLFSGCSLRQNSSVSEKSY